MLDAKQSDDGCELRAVLGCVIAHWMRLEVDRKSYFCDELNMTHIIIRLCVSFLNHYIRNNVMCSV